MNSLSNNIANTITNDTLEQLSGVTKAFESQVITLKSHTESVSTSLSEGENKLNAIREQSELIINQMVLSSKKMSELERQNHGLHDIYATVNELMNDMERIKADYVKSQSQLSVIAREMRSSENEQIESLREQINSLADVLTHKIDTSLEKLHEHYHIAGEDITQSVQILAKKAQLQKGYSS
jgi:archaellum component FlaC